MNNLKHFFNALKTAVKKFGLCRALVERCCQQDRLGQGYLGMGCHQRGMEDLGESKPQTPTRHQGKG